MYLSLSLSLIPKHQDNLKSPPKMALSIDDVHKAIIKFEIVSIIALVVRALFQRPCDFIMNLLYQLLVFILSLPVPMLPFVAFCLAHLTILVLIVCFVLAGLLVCVFPHWLRPPKDGDILPIMRARASTIKTTPKIHNVSDIYHTAFLLKKAGLPGDVIPTILDYAELWFSSPLASSDRELEICSKNTGRICLTAELPFGLPKGSIRTLSFTIHSKDLIERRWHRGSLRHAPNELSGFALSVFPDDMVFTPDDNRLLFPPKLVMNNYHTCRSCYSFFAYERQWHYLSKDKEIAKIMKSLAGGQKLALMMCAEEPAACAVQFSRISCEIAVVRKM